MVWLRRILRIVRGTAWGLAGLLLTVVVLVSLLFGAVQTGAGRRLVVHVINEQMAGPAPTTVSVAALDAGLPWHVGIDGVAVGDQQGTWLSIGRVDIDWRPWTLLSGKARVSRFDVADVAVLRQPVPGPADADTKADEPGGIPSLPLVIKVDQFEIAPIAIDESVIGTAIVLAARGRLAADEGRRFRTEVVVERTDGPGQLNVAATYVPGSSRLTVDGRIDEAIGGLLAASFGLPANASIEASVAGDGPLSQWQGKLDLAVKPLGRLSTDILVAKRSASTIVRLSGEADVTGAVDDNIVPRIAPVVGFATDLVVDDEQNIEIQRLIAKSAAASVEATGRVGADSDEVDVRLSLSIADGGTLAGLTEPARLGSLAASGRVFGSLEAPSVDLDPQVERLVVPGFAVDRLTGRLRWRPDNARETTAAAAGLLNKGTVDLHAQGVRPDDATLATVLGDSVEAHAEIHLPGDYSAAVVPSLLVRGRAVTLEGQGRVSLPDGPGTAQLALDVSDMRALAGAAGTDLKGRGRLVADIVTDTGFAANRATVRGDFTAFSVGVPAVDALLGPAMKAAADVRADDAAFVVERLTVNGSNATLSASARLDRSNETIRGEASLRLPTLRPLSPAIGTPVSGEVAARLEVGGSLTQPTASLDAQMPAGAISGVEMRDATVTARVTQGRNGPQGSIAARLSADGTPFKLDGRFSTDQQRFLHFPDLTLAGAGIQATAAVAVPLAGGGPSAEVTLTMDRTRETPAIAGISVAGSLKASVSAESDRGETSADVKLDGRDLAMFDGETLTASLAKITGSGSVDTGDRSAHGSLRLTLTDLVAGALSVNGATLTADGSGREAAITLAVNGLNGAGNTLSMETLVRPTGDVVEGSLVRLEGKLNGQSVTLRRPAAYSVGGGRLAAGPLEIGVGAGSLVAQVSQGAARTDVSLQLEHLPLAVAGAFVADFPVAGQLSGTAALGGRNGAPMTGTAQFSSTDLTDPSHAGPPMAASVSARLGDETATIDARIEQVGDQPFVIGAVLPVRILAGDFRVVQDDRAPIHGAITWQGSVAPLWQRFGPTDQRLKGTGLVDLHLGGTLGKPELMGHATITDGRYEHLIVGTLLKELTMTLTANGRSADLAASATDGGKGSLAVAATAALDRETGPVVDGKVTFTQATLVRRDDIRGGVNGVLTVESNDQGMRVAGTLTTTPIDVRLVNRLPPSVVQLHVVEVPLPKPRPWLPKEEPRRAAGSAPVVLDIAIQIPGQLFVRGRGLQGEWHGAITVAGDAGAPAMSGGLSLVRGNLIFAGREFRLTRANVAFTGGRKIDPLLDIIAERRTSDITAQFRIDGQASNPQITMTSQPPLPEEEILSQVMFGQNAANIGPVEAAQLALAVDSLARGESVSDDAFSFARGLLGLDVLSVQGGEQGDDAQVEVGRYVVPGLYVGAKQGTAAGSSSGTVQLEVIPGLTLESDVSETEDGREGSVGLKWRWNY